MPELLHAKHNKFQQILEKELDTTIWHIVYTEKLLQSNPVAKELVISINSDDAEFIHMLAHAKVRTVGTDQTHTHSSIWVDIFQGLIHRYMVLK